MRKKVDLHTHDIGYLCIALLGHPILKNFMLMLFQLFVIVLLEFSTIVELGLLLKILLTILLFYLTSSETSSFFIFVCLSLYLVCLTKNCQWTCRLY